MEEIQYTPEDKLVKQASPENPEIDLEPGRMYIETKLTKLRRIAYMHIWDVKYNGRDWWNFPVAHMMECGRIYCIRKHHETDKFLGNLATHKWIKEYCFDDGTILTFIRESNDGTQAFEYSLDLHFDCPADSLEQCYKGITSGKNKAE